MKPAKSADEDVAAFRESVRLAVERFGWWWVLFHTTEVLRDQWRE